MGKKKITKKVLKRKYKIQRIDGLPEKVKLHHQSLYTKELKKKIINW